MCVYCAVTVTTGNDLMTNTCESWKHLHHKCFEEALMSVCLRKASVHVYLLYVHVHTRTHTYTHVHTHVKHSHMHTQECKQYWETEEVTQNKHSILRIPLSSQNSLQLWVKLDYQVLYDCKYLRSSDNYICKKNPYFIIKSQHVHQSKPMKVSLTCVST